MSTLNLVLGRYDDPENQIQDNYEVDLYSSNIAIFGSSMSGKSTLLKTLLVRMHQVIKEQNTEEIYILDFNNALQLYGELPYIKAYFDGTNDENVRRIFKILEEKYSEYSKKLLGKVYSQSDVEERPAHITFILDGLNTFFADGKYENYKEILLKLARDGLAKGITIIFAANELAGGIGRMMGFFNRIIAFDLPKDKYAELFTARVEKPILMEGRGIANIDTHTFEFHTYYPYNFEKFSGKDGEKESLEELVENMTKYYGVDIEKANAERLKTFTTDLDVTRWSEYIDNEIEMPAYKPRYVTVGLDYFKFMPISINLQEANVIAIYGKKRSGKSNLLRLILYGALGIEGVRFVFWEDKRNGLDDIMDIMQQDIVETFPEIGTDLENSGYPSWKIIKEKKDFFQFIKEEGYYNVLDDIYGGENGAIDFEKKRNPFTVFVIQSKQFYLPVQGKIGTQSINRLASFMASASEENVLFVFSDVQNIVEADARNYFNNSVKYAFLFDDIVRFVKDTKGQNTIFGVQDSDELKEMFGKCEDGDGYLFDVEQSDDIMKFKMLNVSFEKMLPNQNIENAQLWEKYQILSKIPQNDISVVSSERTEKLIQKDVYEDYEEEDDTPVWPI